MENVTHSVFGAGFTFDWDDIASLRRHVEQHGLPDDHEDIRYRFVAAVRNAESLRVLFGGAWDETSRRECLSLFHVLRAAEADERATHPTHYSRQ